MITHKDLMNSLPAERRERINKSAAQTLEELRAIRKIREFLGLTQEEFAEGVGASQSNISRLEAGERGLTIDVLSGFVHSLGGKWVLTVTFPDKDPIDIAGSSNELSVFRENMLGK
jgi:transcriptional regulator with XRE-family HTH domain